MRRKARNNALLPGELVAVLDGLSQYKDLERDVYIAYLKSSGERITELVTMNTDELQKWYLLVKRQNDQRDERLKRMREQAARRRR